MNRLKNRNINGELLTCQQAAERSNIGKNTTMRLAREAGAIIKIGRITRIDWNTFYSYIKNVYAVE